MAWTVSLQILLISSCVAFMAIAMKVSVPLALEFVVSHLPRIWSCFLTCLRPPYLYVVVNGIIITIAAASRFHHHRPDHHTTPSPPPAVEEEEDHHHLGNDDRHRPEVDNPSEFEVSEQPEVVYELREEVSEDGSPEVEEEEEEVKTVVVNYGTDEAPLRAGEEDDEEDELVISRSTWTPPTRTDSSEILLPAAEKPLVLARFGHRKPVKSSPEGARVLGVSKPKRHETLENTWKAITEGRSMPISRHMKKCDTWDSRGRQVDEGQLDPFQMTKSLTFKDRQPPPQAFTSPPGSGKLRKEPSLSQDELNRRVEAFINKFNEEMRLQRQESLKRYMEMINGGSH